jgi:hypothetical protein
LEGVRKVGGGRREMKNCIKERDRRSKINTKDIKGI